MRSTGVTAKRINAATGTFMASHYLTAGSQPAIPTPDLWAIIRPMCGDVPAWADELVARIAAEREVVGQVTKARSTSGASALPTIGGETVYQSWSITAPATDAARQWQGWGTALKPALEPITVARKPLIGTVAENVLAHGTGALNVDGCRVGMETRYNAPATAAAGTFNCSPGSGESYTGKEVQGRWPANLIHDGSDEVVGLAGDAARFFYCAKASKADRDEGCEGLGSRFAPTMGNGIGGKEHDPKTATPKRNHHPTVKPTTMMQYLCRLVTPPGGVVLDPFMGSGSTGKAAALEGFDFIGIEREAEYLAIAEARIDSARRLI